MRRHPWHLYATRKHLIITTLIVAAPFFVLLVFSGAIGISPMSMFEDLGISLGRLGVAYIIAAILGWLFAVWFYHGKRSQVMLPVFDVLQSFPAFAALPIAVYFWGATNRTVIFFLVIEVIWPIFFAIISSLKLIQRDWTEAVKIYRLSGWNYLEHYLWPVTLPGVITGSIVGLGEGWESLIATEMIVKIKPGVGGFFLSSQNDPVLTAFGVFAFLLLIFAINKLIWLPLLDWSHQLHEE